MQDKAENSKDLHLSKSLSWLLRHGAIQEGLHISPEGYIQLEEVLQHRCFKGKYNRCDVERVVNNNSKQRFKLRLNTFINALEIKATQGHSFTVSSTELIRISEPKYKTVIHGTYLKHWPLIKEQGLSRMKRKHIHLAKGFLNDPGVVSGVRKDVEILLYVNLEKALSEGLIFYESENGVILTEGNEDGYLELKYITKVVEAHTGKELYPLTMEVTTVQTASLAAAHSKPSKGSSSTTPFQSTPSPGVTPAGPNPSHENGLQGQNSIPNPEPTVSSSALSGNGSASSSVASPSHAMRSSSSSNSNSANQSPTKKPRSERRPKNGQQEVNSKMTDSSTPSQADSSPGSPTKEKTIKDFCKVEVTGYPGYVKQQDLQNIFSNYSQIRVEQVGKRCAVITLKSKEDTQKALRDSMKLCLYGQFLTIKPYTGIDEQFKKQNKFKDTVPEGMVDPQTLRLTGEFGEQLDTLLAAVRLTQEEVASLATLYADLERVLRPVWPGCQAMPFGSITTGLGVKSSDADCFVNVPPHYRPAQFGFVNRAKRVLLQHPQLFSEVFAIPRANTPIVKLRHVPTRTRCDLSFKTPLGALNSKLVAFLLHADRRFVPVAIVVKYWAATHALSGTGRLTNYALTLLLVFYLQRRGLLPPVAALQRHPPDLLFIDGWSAGFTADYSLVPRDVDSASVEDLLGGFFAFYDTFDFDSSVACPLLGAPVAKLLFADPGRLPDEFERYKRNVAEKSANPFRFKAAMCVQDPFEQSHNVASAVTPRLAADVRVYIKFAAEAYAREKASGCRGLLRTILIEKPRLQRGKQSPEYRINFYPTILDTIVHEDWKSTFRETLMTIFEGILKLKLTLVEKETAANGRVKEKYSTIMTKPLWRRKQFIRLYDNLKLGFIEKNTKITEEVLKMETKSFQVEFQVIISYCTKIRSAWVSIRMTEGDLNYFYPFGKYYLSIMQTWVLRVLYATRSTVVKENSDKSESRDAGDSNVANSEIESDNVDDDAKADVESSSPGEPESTAAAAPADEAARVKEAPRAAKAPKPEEVPLPAESSPTSEASRPTDAPQPMEVQASDCQ